MIFEQSKRAIFGVGIASLACVACTPDAESDDEGGTVTTGEEASADTDAEEAGTNISATMGDTDVDTGVDTDVDTGVDTGVDTFDNPSPGCDLFAQDCPEGQKCVPDSLDDPPWSSTTCVVVEGDHAPGDGCTADGNGGDDCDAASFCFEGTCLAMCAGSIEQPICPDGSECLIQSDGSLNLCLPLCNPLELDACPNGQGCYLANGESFACFVTAPDTAPIGGECGYVNDCEPGSFCADAMVVPGCEANVGCCAGFCSLAIGDADCAAQPGTNCAPFYEAEPPAGYEDLGACVML
ncbi:ribulose phosphate epimerase [Nannocystaceae bacterium ST9]